LRHIGHGNESYCIDNESYCIDIDKVSGFDFKFDFKADFRGNNEEFPYLMKTKF
jgi:hypothetical protein